jgi:SnoaL-like domain
MAESRTSGETAIGALYHELLNCWNRRNAADFAGLFEDDGTVVGFDGSQMNGRVEIEATLRQIFADHVTAAYVAKISGVRFLAVKGAGSWRIAAFQNTAAFHGRPELSAQLTEELRQVSGP